MIPNIHINKNIFRIGIPILIIAFMVFFSSSLLLKDHSDKFSFGITVDLLFTIPFIYFLLIRNSSIPKITIIPFIILGIIVGTIILPEGQQGLLIQFKTWVLPILELLILGFIIFKVRKLIKEYKLHKNKRLDFYSALKETVTKPLPKISVAPVVTEIAVFYYGFVYWKKRKLLPHEFSYHKDSGSITLLVAIIFIIAIETVTIHYLLMKWSPIAAWILTGLSIYSAIQIFGFLKSMTKRPIEVGAKNLYLRYGIMAETTIDLKNINSVKLSTKEIVFNENIRKLSFLGTLESHNVLITLEKKCDITGWYGLKNTYRTIALHVDNKVEFKSQIDEAIQVLNATRFN